LVARFAARKRSISLAAAAGRSACGQWVDCLISVSVELAGSNRGAIAEATTSAVISASPVPDRISTGPVNPAVAVTAEHDVGARDVCRGGHGVSCLSSGFGSGRGRQSIVYAEEVARRRTLARETAAH